MLRGGSTFRLLSLLWKYPVLVFTKSVNSNFRVLIGAGNSGYPWLFTHGFATEAEVATIHTNTKKARNFGLSVFTGS